MQSSSTVKCSTEIPSSLSMRWVQKVRVDKMSKIDQG